MHNIDNQNCNITQVGPSGSQVSERLVTWCINNLETWYLQVNIDSTLYSLLVLSECDLWEVGCTYLLGNTTSFTSLHISASQFI